jgi:hypothetical protein
VKKKTMIVKGGRRALAFGRGILRQEGKGASFLYKYDYKEKRPLDEGEGHLFWEKVLFF